MVTIYNLIIICIKKDVLRLPTDLHVSCDDNRIPGSGDPAEWFRNALEMIAWFAWEAASQLTGLGIVYGLEQIPVLDDEVQQTFKSRC